MTTLELYYFNAVAALLACIGMIFAVVMLMVGLVLGPWLVMNFAVIMWVHATAGATLERRLHPH